MLEDLNTRIEEAKRRLAEQQQLKGKLPSVQENLTKEAHRLRMLEYQLGQANDDLKALESVTLACLMEWLLGRKEQKLAKRREEAAELQREYDECVDIIAALDGEVQVIERQLEPLGNADEVYQTLCDEKQRLILEQGMDASSRLNDLANDLSHAKAAYLNGFLRIDVPVSAQPRSKGTKVSVEEAR